MLYNPIQITEEWGSPMYDDFLARILEPDIFLASQFYGSGALSRQLEGEKRLMIAVLKDAVECLDKYRGARNSSARCNYENAIEWVCGNAESLPFPDASFDAYTIAFGIRNVTHIEQALREARRVLRPSGRFLCLEFSKVEMPGLDRLYDAYSFKLLPKLGGWVAQDEESYRYLAESIHRFPPQAQFAKMIASLKNVEFHFFTVSTAPVNSDLAIHDNVEAICFVTASFFGMS